MSTGAEPRCSAEVDRGDNLFHPCSDGCNVLGCWFTRSTAVAPREHEESDA